MSNRVPGRLWITFLAGILLSAPARADALQSVGTYSFVVSGNSGSGWLLNTQTAELKFCDSTKCAIVSGVPPQPAGATGKFSFSKSVDSGSGWLLDTETGAIAYCDTQRCAALTPVIHWDAVSPKFLR
jgi:hypothetical protein